MYKLAKECRFLGILAMLLALPLIGGCAEGMARSSNVNVSLSGSQEVPPVTTGAMGSGEISIAPDLSVSGKITFSGMTATMAHVHEGATGKNGPVIISLTKVSDTSFAVPAGAKLSESQYASYRAGNLYVNIHSEAHPGGEIRAQLPPPRMAGMGSGY